MPPPVHRGKGVSVSTPSADSIKTSSNTVINSPIRGITLMFVSTFFFAAMHVVIGHLTDHLHPFQVAFFRNFFGLIFVIPWFIRFGLEPLRTNQAAYLPIPGERGGDVFILLRP